MNFFIPSLALILSIPLLICSRDVALSLPSAFEVILRVVIAGIFPVSVLFKTFLFSSLGERVSDLLGNTRLFKKAGVSKEALAVIAGQLCGLPMGACLLSGKRECDTPLALSSVPSIAFLVSSCQNGFYIWLISVLVLWNLALLFPSKESPSTIPPRRISFGKALEEGVLSAVQISGAIIFFGVVISVIPKSCPTPLFEALVSLLEMGNGASMCKNPFFLAFTLSFAGLSALCQIYYLSGGIPIKKYLMSRLVMSKHIKVGLRMGG